MLTSRAGRRTAYPKTFLSTSETATTQGSGLDTMPNRAARQMTGARPRATDMPIRRSSELVANSCRHNANNNRHMAVDT